MQLPDPSKPIVIFNSLEPAFAQEIAFNLLTPSITLAATQSIPKYVSHRIRSSAWHLPLFSLRDLSKYVVYSIILDPCIYRNKNSNSFEKMWIDIQTQITHSQKTTYLTPEKIAHNPESDSSWMSSSNKIVAKIVNIQQSSQAKLNICFTRDQYDADTNSLMSPVAYLLSSIRSHQINFPFEAETRFNPSYSVDLAGQIPKTIFGHSHTNTTFLLQSDHNLIAINLLYLVQQSYIDVVGSQLKAISSSPVTIQARSISDAIPVLAPSSQPLQSSISSIIKQQLHQQNTANTHDPNQSQLHHQSSVEKKTHKNRLKLFLSICILFTLSLMIALAPPLLLIGTNQYLQTSNPPPETVKKFHYSLTSTLKQIYIPLITPVASQFSTQEVIVFLESLILENKINIGQYKVKENLVQLFQQTIIPDKSVNPSLLNQIASSSRQLYTQYSSLTKINPDQATLLDRGGEWVQDLIITSQLLEQLLPTTETTNVLVIIQDDSQLTATGGSIHSAVLLQFHNKKLISVDTKSSSYINQQLTGKVDPPAELSKLTDQITWSFQDTNWYPDFFQSAQHIAWWYQKSINLPIDTVVALTFSDLQFMLGERHFEVGEFGSINAHNLKQKLAVNNKADDPDSSELMVQLIQQMHHNSQSLTHSQIIDIYQRFYQKLQSSDILLASSNLSTQALIQQLRFDGGFISPACQSLVPDSCLSESLYLNETSLGANQINQFINRNASHQLTINSNSISHTHSLTLTNNASINQSTTGSYQLYLRVLIPENSTLELFSENEQIISVAELTRTQYQQHTSFGKKIIIGAGETTTIKLTYTSPLSDIELPINHYQLYLVRQPGVPAYPIDFSITSSNNPSQIQWGDEVMSESTFTKSFPASTTLQVAFLSRAW